MNEVAYEWTYGVKFCWHQGNDTTSFWVLHLIHGWDRARGEAPILQGLWGRVRECVAMPAGLLVIVHGPPCQAPASLGPPTPPVCLRTPSGPLQASDRQGLAAYCHLVC